MLYSATHCPRVYTYICSGGHLVSPDSDMLNSSVEEMESVHKCMDTTQKAILSLELYALGLSEETKVLREQGMQDLLTC